MNIYRFLRFSLFFILFVPVILFAQVPNGGFEEWTNGNPDNWLAVSNGLVTNITQSATSHSGSSAVKGEVVSYFQTPWTPILYAGTDGVGFSVDQRFANLNGYYQFSQVEGDSLSIAVYMFNNSLLIGGGFLELGPTASAYNQFQAPIEYFYPLTPDTCWIYIFIVNLQAESPHIGSSFLVDDLSLSGTTAITTDFQKSIPQNFWLEQNYPNPFNPSTTIEYGISQAGQVKLDIYTELGEFVTSLINSHQSPGKHVIQWQPKDVASGVYLYRLETNQGVLTRKMIFIK